MIHHIGSALEPVGADRFIIAHIVNDKSAWGAGFVVPLGEKFPLAKSEYLRVGLQTRGLVQVVQANIGDRVGNVVNMCAQTLGVKYPLDYDALEECIFHTDGFASLVRASVHVPRIGCGLARGDWRAVAELIPSYWHVYTLPNEVEKFPPENYA